MRQALFVVVLAAFLAGCGQALKGITLGWYDKPAAEADSTAVEEEVEP